MLGIADVVKRLEQHYGAPAIPPAQGPFELVIWENACYLLTDERRREVFEGLRAQVGLTAEAIASADGPTLLALAKRGGMRPEMRVLRWREIARLTLDHFHGDLNQILLQPHSQAKSALKLFPSIGDPAAEKILMLCGVGSGLPLESNGLRVLTRLGYGREQRSYGATYKSAQDALLGQVPGDAASRAQAHLLLREHGKTLCKTNGPICGKCPLADECPAARADR